MCCVSLIVIKKPYLPSDAGKEDLLMGAIGPGNRKENNPLPEIIEKRLSTTMGLFQNSCAHWGIACSAVSCRSELHGFRVGIDAIDHYGA